MVGGYGVIRQVRFWVLDYGDLESVISKTRGLCKTGGYKFFEIYNLTSAMYMADLHGGYPSGY